MFAVLPAGNRKQHKIVAWLRRSTKTCVSHLHGRDDQKDFGKIMHLLPNIPAAFLDSKGFTNQIMKSAPSQRLSIQMRVPCVVVHYHTRTIISPTKKRNERPFQICSSQNSTMRKQCSPLSRVVYMSTAHLYGRTSPSKSTC